MTRDGFFTGLDIGTNSIKVLVAELRNGELNVIGVSNAKIKGVKDGIIVDIEAAATAIKSAISQAEEKAGISIKSVNVGLPGNLLQVEPTQGMIPVTSDSKEITDADVENVVRSALTKSMTPDREVITFIPEEFIVDGFDGIKDPRGMIGVRLELFASMITGPKTIVHNIKRCIDKAGLNIEEMVIQPLAISQVALTPGEREFGTVLIDMGGGQTSASVMHDNQLKFSFVDQEGGDFVSKDISIILNASFENAERIKREYGYAISSETSADEFFPVETIGKKDPVKVDEHYLSEIIEARVVQTFETVKRALDQVEALKLPGGIVLTGGASSLAGVQELAQEIFGVQVKTYIPEQMGMRNPIYATSMGLIKYAASLDDVHRIAQKGKPVTEQRPVQSTPQSAPVQVQPTAPVQQPQEYEQEPTGEEQGFGAKVKNFFKMFIDEN